MRLPRNPKDEDRRKKLSKEARRRALEAMEATKGERRAILKGKR